MSFYLHSSGLFYAENSIVKVSMKPADVVRYTIYCQIDPPQIIMPLSKVYDLKRGELLEVLTSDCERHFFEYQRGVFRERHFEPIDILEGEDELEKQLGLLGQRRASFVEEIPLF